MKSYMHAAVLTLGRNALEHAQETGEQFFAQFRSGYSFTLERLIRFSQAVEIDPRRVHLVSEGATEGSEFTVLKLTVEKP